MVESKDLISQTSYSFNLATTGFKYIFVYLYSFDGSENLGESHVFFNPQETVASKSVLILPQNYSKISPNSDITLTWENHGATRNKLFIGAVVNGQYRRIYQSDDISGTSKTFRVPTGFTRAWTSLESYDGTKYLGSTTRVFYTKVVPTVPRNPAKVYVDNIKTDSARLNWYNSSNNESGFRIYKGTKLVKTVWANERHFDLTGLTPNTSYTYTVKAYNAAGSSAGKSVTFKTK